MSEGRPFVRRVAGMFSARVAQFGISITTAFLLSRLLGPDGRGAFALAALVPSTFFALAQFGLPSSFSFFAGRGRNGRALWRMALVLAAGLSLVLLLAAFLLLPVLETNVLARAPEDLVRIALLGLPFQFLAAFCGAILIGRQTLFIYNIVLVGQSALSLALVIILVGVLGLGPGGAIIGNLVVAACGAVAVTTGVRFTTTRDDARPRLHFAELGRYGIRLYPASVASFLSYRVDVFLLGFLLIGSVDDVTARIGLYTLAVSLAELTFFVPDSVATVFFPRVAGAERRSADEMTPAVCRMTVLVTLLAALALIPAAFVAVHLILPRFEGALPAFLVLLPGVMALAVAKVLSSYVSGIGLPLPVAAAASLALVVNIAANFALIPALGIIGAAAASVISYASNTAVLVLVVGRLARVGPRRLLLPTRVEANRLLALMRSLQARLAVMLGRRPAGA